MKNAIVFMAEGYEEMELVISVDMLRRAGINTKTVTLGDSISPVSGANNIQMVPDITLSQVKLDELDLILLPGGLGGTNRMIENKTVLELLVNANKQQKTLAAICAAPLVFKKAGIINNRQITSHPATSEDFKELNYQRKRVVVDSNIITSRAPGTTFEFALTVISQILGEKKSQEINQGVLALIQD